MKSMLFLLCILFAAIAGCGVQELRKEDVASMIRKDLRFPKTFSYEINKIDPASAEKLMNVGLETGGFVSIKKILRFNEIGKPIVKFAEKAEPFLLPTPAGKNPDIVQLVKIADIEFAEVTVMRLESRFNLASIEYTLVYKNITPFARLIEKDLTKPEFRTALLRKYKTGWLLAK